MAKRLPKGTPSIVCVNTEAHSVRVDSKHPAKPVPATSFLAYFHGKGVQAKKQLMKLFPPGTRLEDLREGQHVMVPSTMAARM